MSVTCTGSKGWSHGLARPRSVSLPEGEKVMTPQGRGPVTISRSCWRYQTRQRPPAGTSVPSVPRSCGTSGRLWAWRLRARRCSWPNQPTTGGPAPPRSAQRPCGLRSSSTTPTASSSTPSRQAQTAAAIACGTTKRRGETPAGRLLRSVRAPLARRRPVSAASLSWVGVPRRWHEAAVRELAGLLAQRWVLPVPGELPDDLACTWHERTAYLRCARRDVLRHVPAATWWVDCPAEGSRRAACA